MGVISDTADEVYRDYENTGVPVPGTEHEPIKREIRELFGVVDEQILVAQDAVAGSYIIKQTKALLDLDLAHDAGVWARVVADPVLGQNGYYEKSGSSGSGAWAFVGTDLAANYAAEAAASAGAAADEKDRAAAFAEAADQSAAAAAASALDAAAHTANAAQALADSLTLYGSLEAVEAAATVSVAAKADAEDARAGAEAAQTLAEGAQAASEAARDEAVAHASAANGAKTQAELAALAAGAPLLEEMPVDFTDVPSPFLLLADAGLFAYSHDGEEATQLGPFGQVAFSSVSALKAFTGGNLGPVGTVIRAERFSYEIVSSGEHLTTAGGVLLKVLPWEDGAYHTGALGAPTGTDDTAGLTALLAAAEGGKLVFDYHLVPYASDNLVPGANTHIVLEQGVVLEGRAGSSRCLQLQKENITVEGYGATIKRNAAQTSHPLYINASTTNHAKRIRVRGLTILGNGAAGTGGTGENDCCYIGGNPAGYGGDPEGEAIPEDVVIEDCIMRYPRRNVISVVAGDNIRIRNNVLDGEGAVVLKCGVDIEANKYMADGTAPTRRVRVTGNTIVNCAGINLAIVFGDDVEFEDNEVILSNTTATGIGGGAGGAQFNDDRFRPGDRLGITDFDEATGWITVREEGDPTLHDLGIHAGIWVHGNIKLGSGAAFPPELTSPYRYCISAISADGLKVKLSTRYGFGEIAAFTNGGSGTLDNDPLVSDLQFLVFRPGNCSQVRVRRNKIRYVGAAALVNAINISTFYGWELEDNSIDMGLSTGSQVATAYGYGLRIKNRKGCLTTGGIRAVSAGGVSEVLIDGYEAMNTTVDAFSPGGKFVMRDCVAIACTGDLVDADQVADGVIEGFRANMSGKTCTRGLAIDSGAGITIIDSDLTGAGSSATTAIAINGSVTGAKVIRTKGYSGAIHATGSKTHDFASIPANSFGTSTTVSAPGVRVGDPVVARMSNYTAGLVLHAVVNTNNVVTVTPQNITGSSIDPASGTLSVGVNWSAM